MTIGERIKALREKIGMSQVDFAIKIDVSKQTLYKYENNLITNIPSDKIEAIAKITHVSPSYIMGWDDEAPASFDPDIRRIERARSNMDQKDREKMMNILKASFEDYFGDDYIDEDNN